MIKNYVVEGMTGEACRIAVEEEINEIPGTQGVDVDPATGHMAVTSEGISDHMVARAVENAGFRLREQD
ncbi:MAG: heavy-metal-associated domain-containing protein [Corynebacterium sp.]|uniref:heavy-metal-associated domain-containing protein n=1 Tax=Corynebacterium sp. TaxID=1720 RepID=UPI0026E0D104|nr:heavy-metal-associated domain-containing protein [Corynebacterium sp.]MDO5669785.1 heavy-metal-associated domain-containing protein [Corynebacterium sp.]